MAARALIIGIGNEARGDDAVGVLAARRIDALHLDGVIVLTEQRDGASLIADWQQTAAPRVYLIDAAVSGEAPGTVRRRELSAERLPRLDERTSSHSLGIAQAVEMARILGCLPPSLVLYTVEAQQFGLETPLTPEVARAVRAVAARICAEIDSSP